MRVHLSVRQAQMGGLTDRRGRVVSTPVSFAEGSLLEFRLGDCEALIPTKQVHHARVNFISSYLPIVLPFRST
jgi:hypothetical protein